MTIDEALAELGLTTGATDEELRLAYRDLIRQHHPDLQPDTSARAVCINQAYAVLVRERSALGSRTAPATAGPPTGTVARAEVVRPGIIRLPSRSKEVFRQLCEAAEVVGDVSYVDASNGIFETIVRPEGGPSCSLLVIVHEEEGSLLAECTLESLETSPGPPIERVVADLTEAFRALT